jgi:hypothetical protein
MPDSPDTTSSPAGWRFEHSYARLPQAFHVRIDPTPVPEPQMVVLNRPLARLWG